MRKYLIPKITYVITLLLITCLSIGYTYAYFSAIDYAESNVTLGKINMVWRDYNSNFAEMETLFNNKPTEGEDIVNEAMSIQVKGSLKRGNFTEIIATDVKGNEAARLLEVANVNNDSNGVGAYCRIKIDATYTIDGAAPEICEDGWIQLALKTGTSDPKLITSNGWFFYNGYYYYGKQTADTDGNVVSRELKSVASGESRTVANRLYLSSDSPANMLGAKVEIILTLEGVQDSNDAYKSEWGINFNI